MSPARPSGLSHSRRLPLFLVMVAWWAAWRSFSHAPTYRLAASVEPQEEAQSRSRCPPEPQTAPRGRRPNPVPAQAAVQALELAAEQDGHAGFAYAVEAGCFQPPGKFSGRLICTGKSRHSQHFCGCITCALLTGGWL